MANGTASFNVADAVVNGTDASAPTITAPQLVEVGTYIKIHPGATTSVPNNTKSNTTELKPKALPTYQHVEEMTVQKCFNWCHEQRSRIGESASFFVLKA